LKLWQILLAVGLGIGYGFIEPGRFTYAFGQATLYVFLPALLFEAAWNLSYVVIRRNWIAIAMLAGPGVILTALIVAAALALVGVPFGPAMLTGAILSATDPIAVVAVFRRLKVPATLATIVESESLFNDAVAVALYRAVLAALGLGAATFGACVTVALGAVASAAGGVILGVTLAFAVARALRNNANAAMQIAATIACAYGAYFAADALKLSGIFATIACGIALRYFERRWVTLRLAADVTGFWDVAALLANGMVFFLVGAALEIGRVTHEPLFTIACVAGVVAARFAISWLMLPFPYPRQWLGVVAAAGIRGALSLALALAVPAGIAHREIIIDATFAVALLTLAAGSLTVVPMVRRATVD
jgi:monovalent cation:H+ antiporter, CPA1 family